MTDQLRSGDGLTAVEVAGLDEGADGFDRSLVLKLYNAVDADQPPLVANDFEQIPGASTPCCQVRPTSDSLNEGQARYWLHALLRDGRLAGVERTPRLPLRIPLAYDGPATLDLQDVRLVDGVLGGDPWIEVSGSLAVSSLALSTNPFCLEDSCSKTLPRDSTLFDLFFALAGPPTRDLDGDGLECFSDIPEDGLIDFCCDGEANTECSPNECTETSPNPGRCILRAGIKDGYPLTVRLELVAGRLLVE